MKRIAVVVACLGAFAAAASCDKGTLGTPGTGGNTGRGPLDGIAGAVGVVGSGGIITGDPGAAGISGPSTGSAGFGGSFGGSGFVSCPLPAPACGFPLCGNGLIDSCQVPVTGPGCLIPAQFEPCDGDQFGVDSCSARGYGSGLLTCTSVCTVDDSACSECMPLGGAIASCGRAPIVFPHLATFGIAATDIEVGLAQVDYNDNTGTTRLTFARLDRTLGLIGAAGLEDSTQSGPLQNLYIQTVAVAPTPSGWLVAGCAGPIVFVDVLDSSGKKTARTVVGDGTDPTMTCLTGSLSLAARPTGGALLTWGTYYSASAMALIAADGLSASRPRAFPGPDGPVGFPTSAWIGDAYYVASPVQLQSQGYAVVVRLFRVAADGTTTKVADVLKDEFQIAPGFVTGAGDMRLIYGGALPNQPGYGLAVMSRRIGTSGALLSDPVTLGLYPTYFGRAPGVAFGDDSVVLLSGYEQELLTIERVDATGKISTRHDVAVAPSYALLGYDVVRRGPDAVVAWLKDGSPLMLARVTP